MTDLSEEETRLVGADRVLAVLAELARHPEGIGLEDMARAMASPKPTVHRALAALRRAGFAAQDGWGRYVLGDEFLRLAFANHEARPDHLRVEPVMRRLCERYGETVHYAVLDDRSVIYRAKIDPPEGAFRLTSVVGGRNLAHTTAVGKLLLSYRLRSLGAVRDWVGDRPLEALTVRSITTAEDLHAELKQIRGRGYGLDDEENEAHVACLAVPVFLAGPSTPSGAISISAFAHRTPLRKLVDDLATIRAITGRLEQP
jgi:IclR family acetate operon transcriptional repressor